MQTWKVHHGSFVPEELQHLDKIKLKLRDGREFETDNHNNWRDHFDWNENSERPDDIVGYQ